MTGFSGQKLLNPNDETAKEYRTMTEPQPPAARRYTLEPGLVLVYNERGWVLLKDGDQPIGSDLHKENLQLPYGEHPTLQAYIEGIIAAGREDPLN